MIWVRGRAKARDPASASALLPTKTRPVGGGGALAGSYLQSELLARVPTAELALFGPLDDVANPVRLDECAGFVRRHLAAVECRDLLLFVARSDCHPDVADVDMSWYQAGERGSGVHRAE